MYIQNITPIINSRHKGVVFVAPVDVVVVANG